ncbi:serA [Symbiodinium microadriaticum]|nr:serA [Symbiodinium microadriaticum]
MQKFEIAGKAYSSWHLPLKSRYELIDEWEDRAEITFNDEGLSLAGDKLVAYLSDATHAITALEKMTAEVLTALPDLQVIGKFGVGVDMIDLDAMRTQGKRLGWTGGTNKRSVSELAIAFMLSHLRNLPECRDLIAGGDWRVIKGRQLSDCTIAIIGCGHVGKDLARLLRAFGCRVLAHDILDFPEFYAETGVEPVDLVTALDTADIVSIHLPLDRSTQDLFSDKVLGLMGPDTLLINLARGGIVDEATLEARLKDGRLGAAAFDVFIEEPPQNRTLLTLPNFQVTPHIGGSTEEGILAMGRAAIRGLSVNEIP